MLKVLPSKLVSVIALIGFMALISCTFSQLTKDDPSFVGYDDFNSWMQNYYKKPRPEMFYASFDLINRKESDTARGFPLLESFYGELFRRHPNLINNWILRVENWKLNDLSERLLWNSLKRSRTMQGETILKDRFENATGKRKAFLKDAIDRKPESFNGGAENIRWAGDLDALWGRFFVTGDRQNVVKIISALERYPDKSKVEGVDVADALVAIPARWSLIANSRQNNDVLLICKEVINKNPSDKIRKQLEIVVNEAEKAKQSN